MSDKWMQQLRLPAPPAFFHRMPRNPAYQYELLDGELWLTPRPRYYHGLLELAAVPPAPGPDDRGVRPWQDGDWEAAAPAFAAAFYRVQPFACLEEADERTAAAREALRFTRGGGDGPVIAPACFAAAGADGRLDGGCLVTLLPGKDLTGWNGYHWDEPPPPDAVARRLGLPHLTWIFVAPVEKRHGLGTALLGHAAAALRALGYDRLASTFLLGNDESMLWHWRNGFRLLAHPGSPRAAGPG